MTFHPPNRLFSAAYRKFLYRFIGRMVLLLTTTGRKSGRLHTIGLQYELINEKFYIGAADGVRADWLKNLKKNATAQIQVGSRLLQVSGEVVSDHQQITDFLEYRFQKHPMLIGLILRMDGFRGKIEHNSLEQYAAKIGLVVLTPIPPRG